MPDLRERLAGLGAHRAFLDDRITDQELMTDVLLEWDTLLKLGELALEIMPTLGPPKGGCDCRICEWIARFDALEAGK